MVYITQKAWSADVIEREGGIDGECPTARMRKFDGQG